MGVEDGLREAEIFRRTLRNHTRLPWLTLKFVFFKKLPDNQLKKKMQARSVLTVSVDNPYQLFKENTIFL